MGLLDEAIRQHLELKRRHGADPQEVARQEDEALGPVGGHEPPAATADGPPTVVELDEPLTDEPPAPYEAPAAAEPEPEAPSIAAEPSDEPAYDVQQPTVEFSVEDELRREPDDEPPAAQETPGEASDELEETPEFLQETPEHDRLWFEQKPPRDFDF
jgi:hypothetical protein